MCRALLVIATVDPAQHLDDPDQLRRAADAVLWTSNDAAAVASPEVAGALSAISEATIELLNASEDRARASALHERVSRSIPQTLDRHWQERCG